MGKMIRVNNSSYSLFEELLIKRDNLRKQAFLYEKEYIRVFGDLIIELFKKKIDCIKKRKTIEYCQIKVNYGGKIDAGDLNWFIQNEMKEFNEKLDDLLEENEAAKNTGEISEAELMQIKKIYRNVAKMIHPDINPYVNDSDVLKDLWQRVSIAYKCNDLKEIQEAEILVIKTLESMGCETIDIEIPDIDEKIRELEDEIKKIRETEPYTYKFLLEDEDAVEEKKRTLREEAEAYEEYSKQLDEIMNELLKGGVEIKWQMN